MIRSRRRSRRSSCSAEPRTDPGFWEDDEALIVEKGAHSPRRPRASTWAPSSARKLPAARTRPAPSTSARAVSCSSEAGRYRADVGDGPHGGDGAQGVPGGGAGVAPSKGAVSREAPEGQAVHEARTRYRRLAVFGGTASSASCPSRGARTRSGGTSPPSGTRKLGERATARAVEPLLRGEAHLDRTFLYCVRLELDHPPPAPASWSTPRCRATCARCSSASPGTLRFLGTRTPSPPVQPPAAPRSKRAGLGARAAEGAASARRAVRRRRAHARPRRADVRPAQPGARGASIRATRARPGAWACRPSALRAPSFLSRPPALASARPSATPRARPRRAAGACALRSRRRAVSAAWHPRVDSVVGSTERRP